MKGNTSLMRWVIACGLALVLAVGSRSANAQGTALSYQGRLNTNGTPVTGLFDFRFTVFDAPANGTAQSATLPATGVGVTNGLFTVTLDFGTGVFTGAPRWLEIGVRTNGGVNFTNLSPRTALSPTPYAIFANTASNVVSGSAVKSLNNLKDNVTLAAGTNVTITPNGNTLTIASSGGGSGIWSLNGSSTYYTGGNVGIGTIAPAFALDVSNVNGNALANFTSVRPTIVLRDLYFGSARSVLGGYSGGFRFYTENFWSGADSTSFMTYDNTGKLGLSVLSPQSKLDIDAGSSSDGIHLTGNQPYLTLTDNSAGYSSRIQSSGGDMIWLAQGALPGGIYPNAFMRLRGNGYLGIGTAAPVTTLDVRGSVTFEVGGSPTLYTGTGTAELNRYLNLVNSPNSPSASGLKAGGVLVADSYAYANPGKNDLIVKGKVGIGTSSPTHALEVNGNFMVVDGLGYERAYIGGDGLGNDVQVGSLNPTVTSVHFYNAATSTYMHIHCSSISILGGADLAEPFTITKKETEVSEGSVVVIDEEHPGQLKLSSEPYDARVAGVVSGANGIKPGIQLKQSGALDGGKDVALTGRVYVQADATYGAIKPGDLLTTSATPGHAMKVTDHARAQGAVLGKAMSGLKDGKGMVLVLVTLQ